MVDVDFIESGDIPLPVSPVPVSIQLICPQSPQITNIVINNIKLDVQRMLYKIYFMMFHTNQDLNNELSFQLFIVHFGWIKIMATHVSFIGSNQLVASIHEEFFNYMTYAEFLIMVRCMYFTDCTSSDYYKAFCKIVERNNYIDWKSLETEGCAEYEFQNDNISKELECLHKFVNSFNQYIKK